MNTALFLMVRNTWVVKKCCVNVMLEKATPSNSVASFSPQRTIPTERPPLVGEVNANFCG
jgi:hypothetical protein